MPHSAGKPREGVADVGSATNGAAALEQLGDLRPIVEASKSRMEAVNGPSAKIDRSLRSLVAQMASRAAGCGYCMAHTANSAARYGISMEKEEALWDFETSPLFSDAERAALRVARERRRC